MKVTVNGSPQELPEVTTVGQIVDRLVANRSRVAVERNRAIVPRATLDRERVRDGDEVEVVTLVGGG